MIASSRMPALAAILAATPATLGALEAALSIELHRDAATEGWALRREAPTSDVAELVAVFLGDPGADLRDMADPRLAELRLRAVAGVDVRALAADVLGPCELHAGAEHWPRDAAMPVPVATAAIWPTPTGRTTIWDDVPDRAVWRLVDPPFAAARSSTEASALVGQALAMIAGPLQRDSIERVFGPLAMDGRGPELVARGATWRLAARPIDADAPRQVVLHLDPPLAAEPIVAALGWDDAVVQAVDRYAASFVLTRRRDGHTAVTGSSRLEIAVVSPARHRLDPIGAPAERRYRVDRALVTALRVRPMRTQTTTLPGHPLR